MQEDKFLRFKIRNKVENSMKRIKYKPEKLKRNQRTRR